MMKVTLGLIMALLLAACADITATPKDPGAGVGHPDVTYPGPRAY